MGPVPEIKEETKLENREIAKEVIQAIGGEENIASVSHCATRLRVMINDEKLIDKDREIGRASCRERV